MNELVAIVHFCVQGKGGTPSKSPPGAAELEKAIQTRIGHPGTTWVAACDQLPVAGRMATGEACFVNCPKCWETEAWKAVPDDGPRPKPAH